MGVVNYAFPGLGLLVLVAGGCAEDSSAVGNENATPVVVAQATKLPSTRASVAPLVGPDNQEPSSPEIEAEGDNVAFEYPFPDREDLFFPPANKPSPNVTGAQDDDGVVLMGFANLEEAQAILRIDGIVTPLRAGESRGEVRVLAINPPEVKLQRGDRQWVESLVEAP